MTNTSSYVKALYDLAVENKSTELYYDISRTILGLINETPKIINFLRDIAVPVEEKKNLINEITEDDIYRKFLFVVIEGKKVGGLKMILQKFVKIINDDRGIVEGVVHTTETIDVDSVKKIEEALSNKLDKKVSLSNEIDMKIIGGIKVEVDGQI